MNVRTGRYGLLGTKLPLGIKLHGYTGQYGLNMLTATGIVTETGVVC